MKENFLQQRLEHRKEQGLYRSLHPENDCIDFASNDYLGFARSKELKELVDAEFKKLNSKCKTGSTGSRLLTGNSAYAEEVEKFIADFHKAQAGLIFNSGYDANIGLISSAAKKGDLIFYDELSHASIYDGVRLSKAESFPFSHNDIAHLEERLKFFGESKNPSSNCFVIVESVYSMDGDFSPLNEIAGLCGKYRANLIVDEAHATGIFGANGEGRVVELGLQQEVFARVHTFGKALGCHGAIVLGSNDLRDYLINYSRPFIYTTALPFHSFLSIKTTYFYLKNNIDILLKINRLINLFIDKVKVLKIEGFLPSSSAVQSFLLAGNENVKEIAKRIQNDGFDVRPILSPTVPKGKERIRICIHAFNTEEQINGLLSSLKKNSNIVLQKEQMVSES